MAQDDVIAAPKVVIGIDGGSIQKDANTVAASIGAALTQAERAAAKNMKAVQGQIDKLNAVGPTKSISTLSKAIEQMGGTSTLSGNQLARLTSQVNALAAAGAKVPKNLASLTSGPQGGIGAALSAGLKSATGGFSQGGALGAGLAAIGPAGLAAAAGVGVLTTAATAAFVAIKGLAAQAEQWSNQAAATGLGVTQVQQLDAYMEDAGFQAGDLEKAMKKMATEISTGGDSLAKFGIDVRELKGLAPEDQLRELARQVTSIVDPTERAAAATEAFGKGGAKALAALSGIAQGAYKDMAALSEAQIKQMQDLDNELDAAARGWTNWKNQALIALFDTGKAVDVFMKRGFLQNLSDFAKGGTIGLALGIANDSAASAPGNAGQSSGTDPSIAGMESEQARRLKALALAKEKKDAAEAPARARAALAAAEAYERELERIAAEEKRAAEEANKRWEAEQDGVEKVNAAVAKRLSGASVDIFGTSKEAARDASLAFDDLNTVMTRAGVTIDDLGVNELTRLEAQLVKLEPLTRDDAEANDKVATSLGEVRARLRDLNGEYAVASQKIDDSARKAAEAAAKWSDLASALGMLAGAFVSIGQSSNGAIAALGKMGSALAQTGAGLSEWKKAQATGGLTTGQKIQAGAASVGAVESIIEQGKTERTAFGGYNQGAQKGMAAGSAYGPYGAAAGAFIGGLIGLFAGSKFRDEVKKIGKVLGKMGKDVTDEEVKQIEELGKKTHLGIEDAARLFKKLKDDADAVTKRETMRAGVSNAVQSANDLVGSLKDASPEAAKSAALLFMDAWQAEMQARGPAAAAAALGPALDELEKQFKDKGLDTSFLAGLEHQRTVGGNAAFAGASSLATSEAGIINGLRDAGLVDQGLLGHAAQGTTDIYNQAVAAATAAGDAPAEATKDGLRAVSELLEAQLNASIASGTKLDSGTQALIDLAKQNGIDILADPAIESLSVEKEQLAVLKTLAGIKGSAGSAATGGGDLGGSFPGSAQGRIHAAGGFTGFTGSSSPAFQVHPNEFVAVLPGVASMQQLAARAGIGLGSASLNGVAAGGGVTYGPGAISPTIIINGSSLSQPQLTAAVGDAMVRLLDRRVHPVNAVLAKRGLR
jgi:hypothetical protein